MEQVRKTHTQTEDNPLRQGCGFCYQHQGSGWCVAASEQANTKGFSRLDSGSCETTAPHF